MYEIIYDDLRCCLYESRFGDSEDFIINISCGTTTMVSPLVVPPVYKNKCRIWHLLLCESVYRDHQGERQASHHDPGTSTLHCQPPHLVNAVAYAGWSVNPAETSKPRAHAICETVSQQGPARLPVIARSVTSPPSLRRCKRGPPRSGGIIPLQPRPTTLRWPGFNEARPGRAGSWRRCWRLTASSICFNEARPGRAGSCVDVVVQP